MPSLYLNLLLECGVIERFLPPFYDPFRQTPKFYKNRETRFRISVFISLQISKSIDVNNKSHFVRVKTRWNTGETWL